MKKPQYIIVYTMQEENQETQHQKLEFDGDDLIDAKKEALAKYSELSSASQNEDFINFRVACYFGHPISSGFSEILLFSTDGVNINGMLRELEYLNQQQ